MLMCKEKATKTESKGCIWPWRHKLYSIRLNMDGMHQLKFASWHKLYKADTPTDFDKRGPIARCEIKIIYCNYISSYHSPLSILHSHCCWWKPTNTNDHQTGFVAERPQAVCNRQGSSSYWKGAYGFFNECRPESPAKPISQLLWVSRCKSWQSPLILPCVPQEWWCCRTNAAYWLACTSTFVQWFRIRYTWCI